MQVRQLFILFFLAFSAFGCEKFLNAKSNRKLIIPESVADLQALLEDLNLYRNQPASGYLSGDDYFMTGSDWTSRAEYLRLLYVWAPYRTMRPSANNDWANAYVKIQKANLVLDGLRQFDTEYNREFMTTRGNALFLRGTQFYQLAETFCLPYDAATAPQNLGIALRLNADFNEASTRASLEATYNQILSDLREAAALLPERPAHRFHPSRAAANGWLARVFLSMRRYDSARHYAMLTLADHDELLDFNDLNAASNVPIESYNTEVVHNGTLSQILPAAMLWVDTTLYDSYAPGDLRKTIYFRTVSPRRYRFKGSFDGSLGDASILFIGITTGEMHLIVAECQARAGATQDAMDRLNLLLEKRWDAAAGFTPLEADNPEAALAIILRERRKELVWRGLRWADIRRLNQEGAGIVPERLLDGERHVLPVGDLRYALPLPEAVIELSGMEQNPR